jgi:hypothetical protein
MGDFLTNSCGGDLHHIRSDMVVMELHFDSFDYETQILYQEDFFFFLCEFHM